MDVPGPERGPRKVLARERATVLKHQDSREAMDLTRAEKLKPMVNWMMPLPDRERVFELPKSGEKFGKTALVP